MEQVMDSAFRATQANYEQGYKDGRHDGASAAYDTGFNDGYETGQADAQRGMLTEADFWDRCVDAALDRLIRHFDRTDARVAEALRDVLKDLHHPSRIWDAPKENTHA